MKTNQTFSGKAIIKTLLVLFSVVTVTNIDAQTNLGDKATSDALAAAKISKGAETKAKNFQTAAAEFWKLSSGKPEFKEERLKLALQYADSAKFYFMLRHAQLQKQLKTVKDGDSYKQPLMYNSTANGKDTVDANWLIAHVKDELKKFEKPQTASPGGTTAPTKPVDTEMLRLDLTGSARPEKPMKVTLGSDDKKERTDSLKPKEKQTSASGDKPGEKLELQGPTPLEEPNSLRNVSSKVIVTDAPTQTGTKNIVSWELGVDAGVTWIPNGGSTSEPSFIHLTDPSFGTDSQVQALWNEVFKGMTFPIDDEMKIANSPQWQLGFNAGCIIGKNYEVKLSVGGGIFISKAELPVRVVTMVMPSSPSAPPTTQQTRETIEERVLIGNFNSKLTGRIYFGKKMRGYADAGTVFGLNHSSAVQITAINYSETKSKTQTTVYGGVTVGAGVSVPLTNILSFETGMNADLLSVQKKFAANVGLKAGVSVRF